MVVHGPVGSYLRPPRVGVPPPHVEPASRRCAATLRLKKSKRVHAPPGSRAAAGGSRKVRWHNGRVLAGGAHYWRVAAEIHLVQPMPAVLKVLGLVVAGAVLVIGLAAGATYLY